MNNTLLQGIRVLDFSRVLAGPYCTAMLADLGAEVIKVEPPGGDDQRYMGRMVDGESTNFVLNNRGKKSIRLDMKNPEGRKLAHELVAHCDIVVENFKPGVAARLGIGYDDLKAIKGGHLCVFSDQDSYTIVRPGPRMAEAAHLIAQCLIDKAPKKQDAEAQR